MDIKALQLASRFSLSPNALGYCGRKSAVKKLKRCIDKGKCAGVEQELKKFIVLYPYLRTISEITGLPEFDYRVIEAYWLGNDLLKQVRAKHYAILLKNFAKQGVPKWLIEELKQKKPRVFIPNHVFQVTHVGVGKASGSVPYNKETINNCLITINKKGGQTVARHWGKEVKILTSLEEKNLLFWTKKVLKTQFPEALQEIVGTK